jgi:hexosaminidase
MIELFPSSPFIHIGGDEAYGVDEDLQRDLINLLHAHLKAKGKKTIVWEGPRLGTGKHKVNEEVIHINWRTIAFPADEMLEAGYPVVNAAWDPLYVVDHYPRNNFTMASPQHIYENLNLYVFKHFNPDIKTFESPIKVAPNPVQPNPLDAAKSNRVIGFCMPWWEGREVNYLPLMTPRIIPLAEIAWNPNQTRNYKQFETRVNKTEAIRKRAFYLIEIDATPMALETEGVFHNQTTVTLISNVDKKIDGAKIHYSLDGTQPGLDSQRYDSPFTLDESATLRAVCFVDGTQVGHEIRQTFVAVDPVQNLALGKPVTSSVTSGPIFSTARLTDGGTGTLDYYLGYPAEPEPILITVDLGSVTEFSQVVIHAFSTENAFESYEVQTSADGRTFNRVAQRMEKPSNPSPKVVHDIPKTKARFVRVVTHGCKGYVFDSFSKLIEIQVFALGTEK